MIKEEIKFCQAIREVEERISKEECEKLIDEYVVRRNRIWSEFGHQIVGAEINRRN